jgi:hypothetical protein
MPETEKDAFALPNNGFTAAEYFFIARMHILLLVMMMIQALGSL